MQTIVVYDTNILISGMVWGGIPYDCIEIAITGRVEGKILSVTLLMSRLRGEVLLVG